MSRKLKRVSENTPPPEDVILNNWLLASEKKLLFVVWYVHDLKQLVNIQAVLNRLNNLKVDFDVKFVAINNHFKLATKLGVRNEVTIYMFKEHELLEVVGPEIGTTELLRILGKYV